MDARAASERPHDRSCSPPVAGAEHARIAARLSTDYVLRALHLIAERYEGDVVRAIVAAAVVSANTAHLNRPVDGRAPYAAMDAPPPDDVRRPVSVSALAGILGMPFETTRRHVNRLIATGEFERVQGGVIARTEPLTTPTHEAMIAANYANLRRMMRDLKAAGFPPA
jgi:hypothetical protein